MGLLIYDLDHGDTQLCLCAQLWVILITLAGKISPTSSDALLGSSAVTASPSPPNVYLPANFKMSNAQLAFFLREARVTGHAVGGGVAKGSGGPSAGHPLQRSESFVVFQTKDLPAINISFGPFARDQALSKELLQPASPLDIPGRVTVNWKVRAFIVQARVFSNNPVVQVFFYIAGRDWDDFKAQDQLPCVRLHAFRDVREIKTSCRMKGNLAQCLAQLELPAPWFNANVAPLGRRKGSADGLLDGLTGETLQAELYYTLHGPSPDGECSEGSGHRAGGASRGEPPSQHPLLRIGSISLYQASQEQLLVDKQLDKNMFLRLPEKPLKPGETLRIFLYLMPNSTVEQFTLRVKAKKGVNLLETKSKNTQWKVDWEIQSGAKHSITTIDVNKNRAVKQGDVLGNVEVMQLDFEMENFTSLSVTRRINWNIDYKSQIPPPDSEKVVTELTVVQRDIQAILPLAMVRVLRQSEGFKATRWVKETGVESPLAVDAALGESAFSVTDDKVSITEMRVHGVAGLTLSLQPSPGNSHTMVAKATGVQTLTAPKQEASLSVWMLFSDNTAATLTHFDPKDYNLNASTLDDRVVSVSQEPQQRWPVLVAEGEGSGEMVRLEMTICEACQKTKRKSVIASAAVFVKVRFGPEEDSEEEATTEGEAEMAPATRRPIADGPPNAGGRVYETSHEQPASVPIDYTNFPTSSNQERPTESEEAGEEEGEEEEEDDDDFVHSPRNMTDLEIGMYALLGVFCLAILVFLINCIVFVLKYRHKRIPPEGQVNMDHSHHWVFLGNGQPLRAQCDLSPQQAESPGNPLEGVQTCCHGDHHSSGSSQTSVQSQVHGRGDGSSGGSTKEAGEEASSPTSKRKRVKFTTFTTLPTEELPYNSIPVADEEDIQWVCQDMGFQDPEELHEYMRRIKEIA
ncbi:transmembrane protein 132E [Pungitius pungitius]|uniref:transmembrane protein 132E n=1 Tax=Pungitius pungitius TaxID=134920 RepID=UPI002E16165F